VCQHGEENAIWQAYAENGRPGAYRITFCYPPNQADVITVIDITHHQ
jgi:hypothetical protein